MKAQPFWKTLGIEPTDSEAAVRAAYAAKLKITNPEDDAEGFKRLRAAYEAALWDARWRARNARASVDADDFDDDEFLDEDIEGYEEEIADALVRDERAPAPRRPAPYIPSAAPDPEAEAHRELCSRLESLLLANAPPDDIVQAYLAVRASPAMGAIDTYGATEWWLLNLLHRRRTASDILVDRAIADFGWEQAARRIRDGHGAAGALHLRDRIAKEREADALVARLRDRRHEFNQAYREITRPFAGRNWFSRQKALFRAGLMQRFLDYIGAKNAVVQESFDQDALAWWRERLSKPKPPFWLWHIFVRGAAVVAIIAALVVFLPHTPGEQAQSVSRQSVLDERSAARAACTEAIETQQLNPVDCAHILSLAPDALLMQQYAGVQALRIPAAEVARDHFATILSSAPTDPYALYGEGYALMLGPPDRHARGARMMAQALAARPEVATYFDNLGAPRLAEIPTGVRPRAFPHRPIPQFDTPPDIVPVPHAAAEAAMEHFGMLGALPVGAVRIECLARSEGVLSDCVIIEETPYNMGLGEVALRLASAMRLSPATLAGEPVDRVPIRIPLSFGPPLATASP